MINFLERTDIKNLLYVCISMKAITALHPSLIKQQEELDKVRPLCFPGRQHPNIKGRFFCYNRPK